MSNHIKAKFLGFNYGELRKETFAEMIPVLIEALRKKLPTHGEGHVQSLSFRVSNDNFDAQKELLGKELYMVDAEGHWGLKIGNRGFDLSTGKYVEFNNIMDYLKDTLEILEGILKISHFSQVSLRNINLFEEIEGSPNKFTDIKVNEHWGRQDFSSLSDGFSCGGAATKHVYYSNDYLRELQVASGVVMKGQSYIPHEEWNVWKLRGEIPALEKPQLLINIAGTAFQAPVNKPAPTLAKYSWGAVHKELTGLHDLVNQVYTDITKE